VGQFEFDMDLEITIIVFVCKESLFRREVHFHIWKVDVLAFLEWKSCPQNTKIL